MANSKPVLPFSVTITANDMQFNTDRDLSDVVSDYLSDTYGYCHYGFDMRVIRYNKSNKIHCIEVTNIKWDVDEDDESEDDE